MFQFFINIKDSIRYLVKEGFSFLLFIPGLILLKYFYSNKKAFIILNYHNFSTYNNYKIKRGNILETNYSRNFEKQMLFLKKHFHFSYPVDFFNDQNQNGVSILISFDDGYKDNYNIAKPILEKHNVKCIFFIVTGYIGTENWLWHDKVRYLISKRNLEKASSEKILKKMNKGVEVPKSFRDRTNTLFKNEILPRLMMTWEEVQEILDCGFLIGTHSVSHEILSFLNLKDQKKEIEGSIVKLNKKLKFDSKLFAFPNGLFNKDTLKILGDIKMNYAFTTIAGSNKQSQNKLQIKRIGINVSDSIPILLLKIVKNSIK